MIKKDQTNVSSFLKKIKRSRTKTLNAIYLCSIPADIQGTSYTPFVFDNGSELVYKLNMSFFSFIRLLHSVL